MPYLLTVSEVFVQIRCPHSQAGGRRQGLVGHLHGGEEHYVT